MYYNISENLYVLGKVIIKPDKQFSFLSYLLTGEANILIDTVPVKYTEQFLQDIEDIIGTAQLDAIILNHSEEDHSGALQAIVEKYPKTPIYCTNACKIRLSKTLPYINYHNIYNGEILNISTYEFQFYETPGLHWDDNMVTFLKSKGILFSNDLFGQYAGAEPPLDLDYSLEDILYLATSYYKKVFSNATLEEKKVIATLNNLPIKMIAPGHGVILKDFLFDIVNYYMENIK
ncbi:FprA family A-type flavoprotein [Clostridiisalibacter paucivorans]|uniref:FprA family A-type flavoprotein n=1 Tax=Clostridiisalibacter paucivorans TaxID=408753 RepID=UPI00047DD429|nr:FprA family A-type flavoprotein [Clostridiisalibacter paucivorans]